MTVTNKQPYAFVVRWDELRGRKECVSVTVKVVFHGHYGEPLFEKVLTITKKQSKGSSY